MNVDIKKYIEQLEQLAKQMTEDLDGCDGFTACQLNDAARGLVVIQHKLESIES